MPKLLAWEDIQEQHLNLDDVQQGQLRQSRDRARRDAREAVWRSYRTVCLLNKDTTIRNVDLGLAHSSASDSLTAFILNRPRPDDDIVDSVSPNFLVRTWPPAFTSWSTRSVRDAFFASPQFPRLAGASAVQTAIARGVSDGILAYVGELPLGEYRPFHYREPLSAEQVEISQDMALITREAAEAFLASRAGVMPTTPQPRAIHDGKPAEPYTATPVEQGPLV